MVNLAEREHGMKELRIMVSDEEGARLERLAQTLGVTLEELLKRSVAAYLGRSRRGSPLSRSALGCGRTALRCRTPPSG